MTLIRPTDRWHLSIILVVSLCVQKDGAKLARVSVTRPEPEYGLSFARHHCVQEGYSQTQPWFCEEHIGKQGKTARLWSIDDLIRF